MGDYSGGRAGKNPKKIRFLLQVSVDFSNLYKMFNVIKPMTIFSIHKEILKTDIL